jgi:hypothetical protein
MPGWFKLAAGWVLTVVIALGFSWGAIAQVRQRVEQPGTVVPPSVLANGDESSNDPFSSVSTTSTLRTVRVDPSILEVGDTTSTSLVGGDDIEGDESSTQLPQSGAATATPAPPTSTTLPTTPAGISSPTASSTTTTTTQVSTTSSTTSTTEASAEPSTQTATYKLTGGSVTISFSPGTVTYLAAVPSGDFSTEVKNTGPDEVRVTFESDDHESEFRAEWEDGELKITKKEKDDEED